jgi:hypothetical protein
MTASFPLESNFSTATDAEVSTMANGLDIKVFFFQAAVALLAWSWEFPQCYQGNRTTFCGVSALHVLSHTKVYITVSPTYSKTWQLCCCC